MDKKQVIIEAGKNLKIVLLNYTEQDGSNEGKREVEPYSFRLKNGIEYFYGYDIKKNGIRMFDIRNINLIAISNNSFTPRWPVEF